MAFFVRNNVLSLTSIFMVFVILVNGQTSTVRGRAEFSGTPIVTNRDGVPNLVYNCAKMPALCNNMNKKGGNHVLEGIEEAETIIRREIIDEQKDAPNVTARQASGSPGDQVLRYKATAPGRRVQSGKKLRILTIGDSITVGHNSDKNGGDGNGYRLKLRDDLGENKVVFAGTESMGTMDDNYYAAWSARTIQYMFNHADESLKHRPNLVLLLAGTNDMHPNSGEFGEGNDPVEAGKRLGNLIDKILSACPDAVVLVALILPTCVVEKKPFHERFWGEVPKVVFERRSAGKRVLAVDMSTFPLSEINDCVHPSNHGYRVLGDWWYDFITQIPEGWVQDAHGTDPTRPDNDNGGLDPDIPRPDFGTYPIIETSRASVKSAADGALKGDRASCNAVPFWEYTGKIANGVGRNGDFKWNTGWNRLGQIVEGIGRDGRYVRMVDMNGDGKADYVWVDPDTGETICWINNRPNGWAAAGNKGVIAVGAARGDRVVFADMNGDGLPDYLIINPRNGAVYVWWNYGPDNNYINNWKWIEGGQIFAGVPHANLKTLRFPDINGDGRADIVVVGEGGSVRHWLNMGRVGARDPVFHDQGGIATGAVNEIDRLVFADIDGDGRDDYLIWDDRAGLTGFLNKPTWREGVPLWEDQGPAGTIVEGIEQPFHNIQLADIDGDGKADYVWVGSEGTLDVWLNQGTADTSMAIDGLRFADIDGDGVDDYVWLHPDTGAPTVYLNRGANTGVLLGWYWEQVNEGRPITGGADRAENVRFGDINGDGRDDYLVLHPETGELTVWLNRGSAPENRWGWAWEPLGSYAVGLGPGKNVRFADIDGDGKDDYILLDKNGGFIIYRSTYGGSSRFEPMPEQEGSGIGRSPDEISFHDINGDGKADYVWVDPRTGYTKVWLNNYPNSPRWLEQPRIAGGVGASGCSVRFAKLQYTGRASYVAVDPNNGAISAWLNGCKDLGPAPSPSPVPCRTNPYRLGCPKHNQGPTRIDTVDKAINFGKVHPRDVFEKLLKGCSSTGCSGNSIIETRTEVSVELITGDGREWRRTTIRLSADGSFNSGTKASRETLVEILIRVCNETTVAQDVRGNPYNPSNPYAVGPQYWFAEQIHIRINGEDDGLEAFLNIFVSVDIEDSEDEFCDSFFGFAAAMGGAVDGVAGGIFSLGGLICESATANL